MNPGSSQHALLRRELAELEVAVARRHRLRAILDVDRLIVDWDKFAIEVAQEYRGSIDDYCLELVHRDYVQEILIGATPKLKRYLEVQLVGPDRRFEHATTPEGRGLDLSEYIRVGPGWWWARTPLNLGSLAEVAED